jgi:hypothetical protein
MNKRVVMASVSTSLEKKYIAGRFPLRYTKDWKLAHKFTVKETSVEDYHYDEAIGYLIPLEDE